MLSSFYRKPVGLALAFLMPLSGAVFAADAWETAVSDAVRDVRQGAAAESARVDNALRGAANQLTDQLAQSTRQYQEAQRLGQSSDVPNRYGAASAIDQALQGTVNDANAMLARAKERDDYTMQRRELQNNQSLYAPGTPQHEQFNARIHELDRQFLNRPLSDRNAAMEHLARSVQH